VRCKDWYTFRELRTEFQIITLNLRAPNEVQTNRAVMCELCSPLSTSWMMAWSSVPDGATTWASSLPWAPLKSTVKAAGLLIYKAQGRQQK